MGQEYALMLHKLIACVVDGEDIHPTHNPSPNSYAISVKI